MDSEFGRFCKKKAGIEDSGLVDQEMVAGPATHRKRHSLILPYRFELIRKVRHEAVGGSWG
jgi:hypothetical protein